MSSNIAWKRTENGTDTPFCEGGGGTWAATQSLIVFLVTNVLAHAATIRIPAGSNTSNTVLLIIGAILLPVMAGDSAFHSLGRWLKWCYTRDRKRTSLFRSDKFTDAATSGAVAICVPLKFAPLLIGRWELVDDKRTIVMLDDTTYFRGPPAKESDLGFRPAARFTRYMPFILPSNVEFTDYLKIKIPPSSSALPSIIAIIQIFLSARQLKISYGPSIHQNGLSSPYLAVIPYVLMSLVNLLANTLVGSYRRVTMLRMKKDKLPEFNEVYIVNCLREECAGSKDCPERHRLKILSKRSAGVPESVDNGSEPKVATPDQAQVPLFEEFDGNVWKPVSLRPETGIQTSIEPVDEQIYVAYDRTFTFGFIHFGRKEIWTSLCYQVQWGFGLGKGKIRHLAPDIENKKWRAIFLKQNFIINQDWWLRWGIMMRNVPSSTKKKFRNFFSHQKRGNQDLAKDDIKDLHTWLEQNYPGIKIDLDNMPRSLGVSQLVSGIFLQLLVTVLLGSLTRFRLGILSHAIWLLIWIYGGPLFRWKWLNDNSMDKVPCLNAGKWVLYGIGRILSIALAVSVYGGIAVICVELLGDICNTTFSLSPQIWILIAVLIAAVFGLIGGSVILFSKVASSLADINQDDVSGSLGNIIEEA